MKKSELDENEKEGGFGGNPEENFFRGEITYVDRDILLGDEAHEGNEYEPEYDGDGQNDEDGENDESEFYYDAGRKHEKKAREAVCMRKAAGKKEGKKRRRKRKHRFFGKFLCVVLALALLVFGGMYYVVRQVYGRMHYSAVESVREENFREDGVTNILLIGNDSRENGEDGRSDAMILLSVSNRTKRIQMTSLLRDMYVEIAGHDGNRLNAAYAFGGAELLMDTVEQNLGITVNRYVLVNFEAFAGLVDAVGGVDLELTNEEVQYVNGYLVEYNMLTGRAEGTDYLDASLSGMIHLNGPQALAYSRNRYIGTDFGRTQRQRKVLAEVLKSLPKTVVTNPKGLLDGLFPNLTTNLTAQECYRLCLEAVKFPAYEIVQGSVPVEGSYQNAKIRGMAVLEVDFEQNRAYLRESLYGE